MKSGEQTQEKMRLCSIVTAGGLPYSQKAALCEQIGDEVLSRSSTMDSPNFHAISAVDLRRMAELYDEAFFQSNLLALARKHGLSFRWSSRMTSAGGKTIRTTSRDATNGKVRVQYEIALSSTLLFQTFSDLQRPIRVTGITCANRLQAMQRILEHELIHLTEMLIWDDSCCAERRFQEIALRMFSHTEHHHKLITQHERAAKKFNVRVGSLVAFDFEGRPYIGNVNRITRRATVLVCDATGQLYRDGKRYRKYYVPISQLRLVA